MRTAAPPRHLLVAMAIVLAGTFGCAAADPVRLDVEERCAFVGDAGQCIAATPGCSPFDLSPDGNGGMCAQCTVDEEVLEVCGPEQLVFCYSELSVAGHSCEICTLDGREVLYEDCSAPGVVERGRCEKLTMEGSPLACEICFDDGGEFLRQECAPPSDYCEEEVVDGRRCEVCYDGATEVYRTCDRPSIDPASCEVYGDDGGRCIDCFDHEHQLVSHECSFFGEDLQAGLVHYEERRVLDDLLCSVFTDLRGNFFYELCERSLVADESCSTIQLPGEECTACTDTFGRLRRLDCRATPCEGNDCVERATCSLEIGSLGVCRVCDSFGGGEQRACAAPSIIHCTDEDRVSEPTDPASEGPSRETCRVCADENSFTFYDSCKSPEIAPPSYCTDRGDGCADCYDSQGSFVGTVCPGVGGGSCALPDVAYSLLDEAGETIIVDGQPVYTQCQSCGQDSGEDTSGSPTYLAYGRCVLDLPCDANGATAFYDEDCPDLVTYARVIDACGANPWDPYLHFGFGTYELLEAVQAWGFAAEQEPIPIFVATMPQLDPSCAEQCGCSAGQVLSVKVPSAHGSRLEAYGFTQEPPPPP